MTRHQSLADSHENTFFTPQQYSSKHSRRFSAQPSSEYQNGHGHHHNNNNGHGHYSHHGRASMSSFVEDERGRRLSSQPFSPGYTSIADSMVSVNGGFGNEASPGSTVSSTTNMEDAMLEACISTAVANQRSPQRDRFRTRLRERKSARRTLNRDLTDEEKEALKKFTNG